jgi:hypothetical protein
MEGGEKMVKFNDEIAKDFDPEQVTKKGKVDYQQIIMDFDKSGKVKTGIDREDSDPQLDTMVVSLRSAIAVLKTAKKIRNVAIHVQSHKGDKVGKSGKAVRVVDSIILYKKAETEETQEIEASKGTGKKTGKAK